MANDESFVIRDGHPDGRAGPHFHPDGELDGERHPDGELDGELRLAIYGW